jgi:hypothetical protein
MMTPLVSSNFSFNNSSAILSRSIVLYGETEVLGENHRPVTSYWHNLS